jgi:hypothetical protein
LPLVCDSSSGRASEVFSTFVAAVVLSTQVVVRLLATVKILSGRHLVEQLVKHGDQSMRSSTREPRCVAAPSQRDGTGDDVRTQVWALLATLYPRFELVERRRDSRYPFPHLIHLTPVAEDGVTPTGKSIVVVGKHLSDRGLGFYHPQPLQHRRMIASLENARGELIGFLVDLSWCRFTKDGWYESGGRFLQTALPPDQK